MQNKILCFLLSVVHLHGEFLWPRGVHRLLWWPPSARRHILTLHLHSDCVHRLRSGAAGNAETHMTSVLFYVCELTWSQVEQLCLLVASVGTALSLSLSVSFYLQIGKLHLEQLQACVVLLFVFFCLVWFGFLWSPSIQQQQQHAKSWYNLKPKTELVLCHKQALSSTACLTEKEFLPTLLFIQPHKPCAKAFKGTLVNKTHTNVN